MAKAQSNMQLRIGILIVTLTWFFFTGFQFIKSAFNIFGDPSRLFWVSVTDTAGTFGLGFRTMTALIAVLTILFYIAKKDLSKSELMMTIRWIILGETVFMLALFPVIIWSFASALGSSNTIGLGSFIESTLPVFVESVIIPVVLLKLFLELNSNKSAKGPIKWGLITGTVYLFMFWLNNTGNWIGAIERKGIEYVTIYPDHILSFGITTVGLLALTIYAAFYTVKSTGANTFSVLNFRKIGAIITLLGLYFLYGYVSWLFLGTDMKWSTWYAWLLGHNMDLWLLSLPLIGIPLMFSDRLKQFASKQLTGLLYVIEVVGAVFMGLFVSVYVAGITQLPDYVVYHSEPTIRLTLSILGGLLVALIILGFIIGLLLKRKSVSMTKIS
jgi:hypothetical protein